MSVSMSGGHNKLPPDGQWGQFEIRAAARVQSGATFPVQVDAADPQKVRIDFNQPIT
jgi:hypothetical protein